MLHVVGTRRKDIVWFKVLKGYSFSEFVWIDYDQICV